jgi:hypothetical protein
LTPGAHDAVAAATLSAFPADKAASGLQAAVQALVYPGVTSLPSTGETPRSKPRLPRRWRAEPAIAAHRRRLAEGPLTAHLSPELQAWLSDPARGELSPDLRLGMEAVSLLHSWWSRYREHLREVDPTDLIA